LNNYFYSQLFYFQLFYFSLFYVLVHKQRNKIGLEQENDEIEDSGEEDDQFESVYDLDVQSDSKK